MTSAVLLLLIMILKTRDNLLNYNEAPKSHDAGI